MSARQFLLAIEDSTDDCILWPFGLLWNGYARVKIDGRDHRAHRVVCEKFHGPCPKGMECRHLCGVRACVNPRHLRWGTRAENMADMEAHGTRVRGSRCGWAKVTEEDVVAIRKEYASGNVLQRELAARYGVDQSMISLIVSDKKWRHL